MCDSISVLFESECRVPEVTKYLESGKILYRQTQREIVVDLGREPAGGMVCDYPTAYASLEFAHPQDQMEASPTDIFATFLSRKWGIVYSPSCFRANMLGL